MNRARRISPTVFGFALLLLAASAVQAAEFTILLKNGHTFATRYQPRRATWDSSQITFLDEVGNWVALPEIDVESVISDAESRGYGRSIDSTTLEFGFAPNDLPEQAAGEAAARQPSALDEVLSRSYDTQQFAEPGTGAGGFPVFGIGASGVPQGAGTAGGEPASNNQ